MSKLTVSLFGSPSLTWDGVPIALPSRKALALLAYLVVTGVRQRRTTLATLLWPESDRERAHNMLRTTLSRLRSALKGSWLVADRRTVGLDGSHEGCVDVLRFRSLLAQCQAHGHGARETWPECLPLLGEAAELYGGDFLDGFTLPDSVEFDTWQSLETEALRQELVGALERLVQGYAAQAEVERAQAYAKRWLAVDPLDEAAHRALMQLYAGSGQLAAALRQYEACQRVLCRELDVSPGRETRELYQAIKEGRVSQLRARPPSLPRILAAPRDNLPAPLTPFIGREGLLAQIRDRLQDPACRLLSLVGPGGSGKTRLALEAAGREVDHFDQGVFFVSLAPLESVDAIVPTVAQALGLPLRADADPQQQLLDYLRTKHMLLFLDNFEHLLEGVEVVSTILRTAPQVQAMTTSRARLNARGEHPLPILGMDVPPAEAPLPLSQYSAIQLFVSTARRVRPDFHPGAEGLAHVADICRLVQGMPLAILLAASWIRMLTPAEIAGEMRGQSLDFLETKWRDVPERQRTMRAVFDHSWDLLSDQEQDAFAGLSVFRGGFLWAAAQEITGASLRDLVSLMDWSLLQRGATGRYEVHELLRQYAAEQLARSEVETAVRDRHCATYAAALEGWEAQLRGPKQREALQEMAGEINNARAAWNWAVEEGHVARVAQATDGLCRFYERRGRFHEGEGVCRSAAERFKAMEKELKGEGLRVLATIWTWQGLFNRAMGRIELACGLLEQGLALLDNPPLAGRGPVVSLSKDTRRERAFLLQQLGLSLFQSDRQEAGRLWDRSLALYRALGDRWGEANVLSHLGELAQNEGDYVRADQLYEESLVLRRSLGDQKGIADALMGLGSGAAMQGQLERAERLMRESIALRRQTGDRVGLLDGRFRLACRLVYLGRFPQARSLLEEIVAAYDDLGMRGRLAGAKEILAWTKVNLGRYEEARALAEDALGLFREMGNRRGIGLSLLGLGGIALAEEAYAEARLLLRESVAVFRQIEQRNELPLALIHLGHAERGRGRPADAQRCLYQAVHTAVATGDFASSLFSVCLAALLLADRGEVERASELYALAMRYPYFANSRYLEDITGKHIAAAAATLPPEVVALAEARGRARDLEATVAELEEEMSVP